MGMDSVEIVMGWEESFGIAIPDSEAVNVSTPKEAIDLICSKLNMAADRNGTCLSMRAFHRLRRALVIHGEVPRSEIQLGTKLNHFGRCRLEWDKVRASAGLSSLPKPRWYSGTTIREFISSSVLLTPRDLKMPEEPWTRGEVRDGVRAVIKDVMGVKNFKDEDRFIEDIGVC